MYGYSGDLHRHWLNPLFEGMTTRFRKKAEAILFWNRGSVSAIVKL